MHLHLVRSTSGLHTATLALQYIHKFHLRPTNLSSPILYGDDILHYRLLNSATDEEPLQRDVSLVSGMKSNVLAPSLSRAQLLSITYSRRAPTQSTSMVSASNKVNQ